VSTLTGGSAWAEIVIALLAVLGGICAGAAPPAGLRRLVSARARTTAAAGRDLTWLAVPWLVLPPLILIAASLLKPGTYPGNPRCGPPSPTRLKPPLHLSGNRSALLPDS
jgi:hypothetical protein